MATAKTVISKRVIMNGKKGTLTTTISKKIPNQPTRGPKANNNPRNRFRGIV